MNINQIPNQAKTIIEYIQETKYKPNDFERKFLKSVSKQIEEGKYLSDKQAGVLLKIYEKATV